MTIFIKRMTLTIGAVLLSTFASGISFTNLHNFIGGGESGPLAQLILSGGTLYGTTSGFRHGDQTGSGTVFAINTDGMGFTNFHISYGAYPEGQLVLSGNTLYTTANSGGEYGAGTIFKINSDWTGFTNLYDFLASDLTNDGYNPMSGLVLSSNTLYGTAVQGGPGGAGTIFKINTDGSGFTTLCNFDGTNGSSPVGGLVFRSNTLYGTTSGALSAGFGTIFKISADGLEFTNLHIFSAVSGPSSTNTDGVSPEGVLVLSGNVLYGTTRFGGSQGVGTVFRINIDGTGFTNLHNFSGNDGANPYAGLFLSENTLYGTTIIGGTEDAGTVFKINTDGTSFTNLYNFIGNSDGAEPYGGVLLVGNTLYGTTFSGGSAGYGTVFAITLSPAPIPLNIQLNGDAVVLSWSDATFSLQTAPAVTGVYTNLPGATSPYTNSVTGTQQFFRLQAD